jgi:hypothetical protein
MVAVGAHLQIDRTKSVSVSRDYFALRTIFTLPIAVTDFHETSASDAHLPGAAQPQPPAARVQNLTCRLSVAPIGTPRAIAERRCHDYSWTQIFSQEDRKIGRREFLGSPRLRRAKGAVRFGAGARTPNDSSSPALPALPIFL